MPKRRVKRGARLVLEIDDGEEGREEVEARELRITEAEADGQAPLALDLLGLEREGVVADARAELDEVALARSD